jgi:PIN domain nuclease of toxin-antitoxin system
MMVVFDASAVLAIMHDDRGADIAASYLSGSMLSAVNYAEVIGKLVKHGMPVDSAALGITRLIREVVPFTQEQGKVAGELLKETQSLGLSLGDRACLALGQLMEYPVLTAEQSWSKVKGVKVQLIR